MVGYAPDMYKALSLVPSTESDKFMEHHKQQTENVDNDVFRDQVVQWAATAVKYCHIYEYDTPPLGIDLPF